VGLFEYYVYFPGEYRYNSNNVELLSSFHYWDLHLTAGARFLNPVDSMKNLIVFSIPKTQVVDFTKKS
jgi:hypothetical protein